MTGRHTPNIPARQPHRALWLAPAAPVQVCLSRASLDEVAGDLVPERVELIEDHTGDDPTLRRLGKVLVSQVLAETSDASCDLLAADSAAIAVATMPSPIVELHPTVAVSLTQNATERNVSEQRARNSALHVDPTTTCPDQRRPPRPS